MVLASVQQCRKLLRLELDLDTLDLKHFVSFAQSFAGGLNTLALICLAGRLREAAPSVVEALNSRCCAKLEELELSIDYVASDTEYSVSDDDVPQSIRSECRRKGIELSLIFDDFR